MVETFKNLLLQNQKSYGLETWRVALGTQALQIYINDDPGLTLTYFTCFCTYSRPRNQVSIYRTIGPLLLPLVWYGVAESEPVTYHYRNGHSNYEEGHAKPHHICSMFKL